MEKTTYKKLLTDRHDDLAAKVRRLTGMGQNEVNEMMFEIGSWYIIKLCHNEQISDAFMLEPLYWAWWRNQWALVDEVYWNKYHGNIDRDNVRRILQQKYRELHANLEFFPDKIVYNKIHDNYMHTTQQICEKHRSLPTE
ncbi:MAG TPA: hypothetical protein P5531_10680 [Bacteroidales bacterium]|nr:hypothetical protein [Bacteroidales bacterium]HSA43573.1 hypothetical protein [Bacteroidales bacterium]